MGPAIDIHQAPTNRLKLHVRAIIELKMNHSYKPWLGFKPVDLLCFCSVLCLLCLCVRLFICALWSPAGKGLASWLSFVVSNCEFVTFPLVSLVGCGTGLYRFLIFATLHTIQTVARKSLTTIARHEEDKQTNATSSLFTIKTIAKLKLT